MGELATMPIDKVHTVLWTLKSGRKRYYYYVYRGGPRFYVSDGRRVDSGNRRLPSDFIRKYEEAKALDRSRDRTGTLGAAITLYLKSKKFGDLSAPSQATRKRYLESFRRMELNGGRKAELAPLEVMDLRSIAKFITKWRDKEFAHSKSAADQSIAAVSAFLTWCKKEGRLDFNRCLTIDPVYSKPDEPVLWTGDDEKAFLAKASREVGWILRFGKLTGLRRADLITIEITAREGDHFVWRTSKSGKKRVVIIPIVPELDALLSEIDEVRRTFAVAPTTVLFNTRGGKWTPSGASTSFDKVRADCEITATMHDLRKTAATYWVILQRRHPKIITDQDIIDMFGWTPNTLRKMKRIYVSDEAIINTLKEG
ncbi:MAG: hypothetical protein QNI84_13210 [Henriciella sp.]|nr:hypothetical protein [Henriciella sp.]